MTPAQNKLLQHFANLARRGQHQYSGAAHRPQTIRACLARGWIINVYDHRYQSLLYEITYQGYLELGICIVAIFPQDADHTTDILKRAFSLEDRRKIAANLVNEQTLNTWLEKMVQVDNGRG